MRNQTFIERTEEHKPAIKKTAHIKNEPKQNNNQKNNNKRNTRKNYKKGLQLLKIRDKKKKKKIIEHFV